MTREEFQDLLVEAVVATVVVLVFFIVLTLALEFVRQAVHLFQVVTS